MLGSIRLPLTSFGMAVTFALLSGTPTRAQEDAGEQKGSRAQVDEEALDRTPRRCLTIARIRDTDILDDRTILFHLRGNKEVYRTYLPRECPGLERNDRFSYRSTNGQLCDVDQITVLEQTGLGLSPGFTCQLGGF